jgi:hypothetical protein
MTADELYAAEDTARQAMSAAVLNYDGASYDGIEAAYVTLAAVIGECPDNANRAAALSALVLCKMRAKAHIDARGIESARVYPGDYLAIITGGLCDARMLAVASLYG